MSKRAITAIKIGPVFTSVPGVPSAPLSDRKKITELWQKMKPRQREAARSVLHRHIRACQKTGVPVERMDLVRVLTEACEMAITGSLADLDTQPPVPNELRRAYDVYVSPVDN